MTKEEFIQHFIVTFLANRAERACLEHPSDPRFQKAAVSKATHDKAQRLAETAWENKNTHPTLGAFRDQAYYFSGTGPK